MTPAPEVMFAFASDQNHFFVELAEALVDELGRQGVPASIATDVFPAPQRGRIAVLMPPHEYATLCGYDLMPGLLERCIGISAEQPSSHFFTQNVELASQLGAVFDINPRAIRHYSKAGADAELLALGHTPQWDRFDADERDIDVLFMGRITERRARALSSYAPLFERYRCHLQLSDNSRPAAATDPDFLTGEAKRALMARAKVLLSIHGEDDPYFEWLRMAEGICAGCLIVSEHSTDMAPLIPGTHIVTGAVDRLGLLCAWAVDDAPERNRIRRAAYDLMVAERPLADAARALAVAAARLDESPVSNGYRTDRIAFLLRKDNSAIREFRPPVDFRSEESAVRRGLKSQALAALALRRRLDRLERELLSGAPVDLTPEVQYETPGWEQDRARRVTVIVPLYNHASHVRDALESITASDHPSWETVIVDDASTDDGNEVVMEFLSERPSEAWRLVRHPINRGLPHARNAGVAHGTGGLLVMLDADNAIGATGLSKLERALAENPSASFAYGIISRFSANGPEGLMSALPWNPQRLRQGNYIDALAMIRREVFEALGGYGTDPRLHGWEDYDFWVRLADSGRHAAFVPEMIARYRVSPSSMISFTNLSVVDAFAALIEHAPTLLGGIELG